MFSAVCDLFYQHILSRDSELQMLSTGHDRKSYKTCAAAQDRLQCTFSRSTNSTSCHQIYAEEAESVPTKSHCHSHSPVHWYCSTSIRIRTDTVIAPGGQLALNRKPGELQVGAALNSGADEKAPMQQRAFRPHVIKRFVSL